VKLEPRLDDDEALAPGPAREWPIVFFDGVCVLCNRSVTFLVRRDRAARLRFAQLQGELASKLLPPGAINLGPEGWIVLLEPDGRVSTRSRAVLRILGYLPWPWRLAAALERIPGATTLLDFLYRPIVRNRYRWFGRYRECAIPDPALRARLAE
jgi:predicted DCC family thiol-disulfide oxidoreductase YuxK